MRVRRKITSDQQYRGHHRANLLGGSSNVARGIEQNEGLFCLTERQATGSLIEQNKQLKCSTMAAKYKSDLRFLAYSPDGNPLLDGIVIPTKRGQVRTGFNNKHLVDADTGELTAVSAIMKVEEKDDREFVKVFAEGVRAAFGLSKTAYRVFQAVLDVYQDTKMTNGYADSVYLAWFDDGLCGKNIGMSEYTYKRGFRELLDKQFLAPRTPNLFWVNPALFFKGDVVRFVKEYRRKTTSERPAIEGDTHLQVDAFEDK